MEAFRTPRLLSDPHVQSILASIRPRRWLVRKRASALIQCSKCVLLNCGEGVRLQGYYNACTESSTHNRKRSLVILIHGWEGCSDSLYMLSAGHALLKHGYDVFRLNLRDHGNTHHLNQGLFHSCRIDEAVGAVRAIQTLFPDKKLSLAGFSLGGNFALRIAARAEVNSLDLFRTIAICPVLNPASTLSAMERRGRRIYHHYFIRRWLRSLRKKQRHFPDLYNLNGIQANRTLRSLTEYLIQTHTEFPDLESYLNGYSITGDVLQNLKTPSHLILSRDDPVIPIDDLDNITRPECMQITITEKGGHCAFIRDYRLTSWLDNAIVKLLNEAFENANRMQESTGIGFAYRSQAL